MHMVIRAIVYAKTEKEALEKAKEVFDKLVEWKIFDYYVTFDGAGTAVSGRGRWGDLPAVADVTSKNGKQLIEDGMKFIKEDFMDNIKEIRKALKIFSDRELFEGKNMKDKTEIKVAEALDGDEYLYLLNLFRMYCDGIAKEDSYLFNDEGGSIDTPEHLKNALNKYKGIYEDDGKENPYKNMKIWVVPADVHH